MEQKLSIILSAGRSCFVKCPGCYNFFGKNKTLTSTETLKDFLGYAHSTGVHKVTIGGGDPLSRPDILDLLRYLREREFRVHLDTVGTPLLGDTETYFYGNFAVPAVSARELAILVDLIGIPVDGISNDEAKIFRTGRPDFFNEQLRVLELLGEVGANICVNSVIHKNNYEDIHMLWPKITNFPSVQQWQCFQFMPIGPLGFTNRSEFEIADELFLEAKDRIELLTAENSFSCEVEFKSRMQRKGNYLLIDTDGVAWVPNTTITREWNAKVDPTKERIVLGNINNKQDYSKLLEAVHDPSKVYGIAKRYQDVQVYPITFAMK